MLTYNIIKQISLDYEGDAGNRLLYQKMELLETFFAFYEINMDTKMYPKGIFKTGNKVLYLFKEKTIICIDLGEVVSIKEIRLSDIKSYELKLYDRYSISLELQIENSETIFISNTEDCNVNYKSEFFKYIVEVLNIVKNK
ncbi:MAG: hypothetical protein ACYDG2_22930 [Ruminiclostridium sp.]